MRTFTHLLLMLFMAAPVLRASPLSASETAAASQTAVHVPSEAALTLPAPLLEEYMAMHFETLCAPPAATSIATVALKRP